MCRFSSALVRGRMTIGVLVLPRAGSEWGRKISTARRLVKHQPPDVTFGGKKLLANLCNALSAGIEAPPIQLGDSAGQMKLRGPLDFEVLSDHGCIGRGAGQKPQHLLRDMHNESLLGPNPRRQDRPLRCGGPRSAE